MKLPLMIRPLMTILAVMALSALSLQAQDDSIIERLGLTPAQQGQIHDLREKFRAQTEQIRSDIRRLVEEEKKLKSAPSPNEAALRAKLKERADKEIELSLALTRFNEQVEGILTPAQQKLLEKIRSERRK
jgi:Spy/CpxP family protein refolding chaperone